MTPLGQGVRGVSRVLGTFSGYMVTATSVSTFGGRAVAMLLTGTMLAGLTVPAEAQRAPRGGGSATRRDR